MRRSLTIIAALAVGLASTAAAEAGSWSEDQFHDAHPGERYSANVVDRRPIYSFPVNTSPDGWAALKAEPWTGSARMTKVYDGTLFLVIGAVPGWKLVRFKSGEQGWIAERLVGCCRPPSR